jgi:hypothetical protein
MWKLDKRKVILLVQALIIFALVFSIIGATNLKKVFKDTRNLVRGRHMEIILNAVYTYYLIHNKFPECIPEPGKAIEISKCEEIKPFLTSFPKDPLPEEEYLIEYFNENKENIRIFSSALEAKEIEIIR